MQLVILAAGHGRRFGGLKQLAPVGPNGEAIMDFTARAAHSLHFDGAIVVVREEIRAEIAAHLARFWPDELAFELVCQGTIAGTGPALASAGPLLEGPFVVANADDLYGLAALEAVADQLADPAGRHALVAYRLANTVVGGGPVKRGVCTVEADGRLRAIEEFEIERAGAGFRGHPVAQPTTPDRDLPAETLVSMNLWGFHPRFLTELAAAIERRTPLGGASELLLPAIVGQLLASGGDEVAVRSTEARCVGMTHREDLGAVRTAVADALADLEVRARST